jgi:superoxide reductase
MHILQPNRATEGAEKHVPIIDCDGNGTTVKIGMQLHPMAPEHRIEWIALTDGERVEIQKLGLTNTPIARFSMTGDKGKLRAYTFCNIHGLWSSEK